MAPSAGSVVLEVVAKVDQAIARLSALESKVQQLVQAAGAAAPKNNVKADEAISRIEAVRSKLAAFRQEAASTGSIVLKGDATQLLAAVSQAEKAVTTSLDRIKSKAKEADPLKDLAVETEKSARKVNEQLDKLDKKVDASFAAMRKRASEKVFDGLSQGAAKEAEKLNAEFRRLETSFAAAVRALNTESRRADFSPASESARKLRENVRLAAEDIVAFAGRVRTSTAQAGGDFKRLEDAERAAAQAVRDFPKEGPIPQSFFSRMTEATNAVRLFLGAFVVQQIVNFAQGVVSALERIVGSAAQLARTSGESAIQLELLEAALKGLLGGTDKANEALSFLRQTADDFGVSFIELVSRFRSFAPAAKEAGLSAQQVRDVFRSVALSARALGFSTEETQRALLAFQQVLQKGKFQGEELTRQLGQLLPNALKILERETGKPTAELLKMMEQGKLTGDAILALSAGMTEAFGPTAVGNARATAAEIERFKNLLFEAKTIIGSELLPPLRALLQDITRVGANGESTLRTIGRGLALLLEPLAQVVRLFGSIFPADESIGIIDRIKAVDATMRSFVLEVEVAVAGPFAALIKVFSHLLPDAIGGPMRKAIDEQIDLMKQYTEGLKESADQARGAADSFEDSWTKAASRVAKENEEAARRLREGYADAQKKIAEGSEELTKKEAAELKKREDALRAFFKRITDLFKSESPTVTPGEQGGGSNPYAAATRGASDYERQVASLQQQLAQLRAEEERIRDTPIISPEDGNRAQELRVAIRDVEEQLRQLQATGPPAAAAVGTAIQGAGTQAQTAATAFEQARDRIAAALRDLTTSNEAFREAFSGLAGPAQQSIIAIIDQFEQMNRVVGVTAGDVADFGRRLAEVFAAGGQVSRAFAAELASGLGAVGTNAGGAADALRALATQAAETAAVGDQLAAAQRAQTAAADPLVGVTRRLNEETGRWEITQRDSVDAVAAHSTALQGLAKLFDEQPGHILTAEESIARFGLNLEDAAKVLRDGGVDVIKFHNGLQAVEKASTEAGGSLTTASGEVIKIGEAGKEAGKGLDEAGKKIEETGKKKLDKSAEESVTGLAKASHAAAEGLQKTGAQADAAKSPLEAVATSADKLSKIVLPPALGEAVGKLGVAATGLRGPLEGCATAAVKLGDGLGKVAQVDPEQVTKLGTAFAAAAGPLTAAAEPAGRLGTALNTISASLSSITASAEPFSAALTSAGTAIQTLADSGSTATLSSQLDSLHGAASKVATDFTALAKGATDFSGQVQPVSDAATEMTSALGKLDLKPAVKAFDELNASTVKLGGSLGTAGQNAGKLDEKTKAAATSTADLKAKMDDLATLIKGAMHTAISGTAVPDLGEMKKAFTAAKTACGDFITETKKLDEEAIPAIKRATDAVAALATQIERALAAQKSLNQEMANAKLG